MASAHRARVAAVRTTVPHTRRAITRLVARSSAPFRSAGRFRPRNGAGAECAPRRTLSQPRSSCAGRSGWMAAAAGALAVAPAAAIAAHHRHDHAGLPCLQRPDERPGSSTHAPRTRRHRASEPARGVRRPRGRRSGHRAAIRATWRGTIALGGRNRVVRADVPGVGPSTEQDDGSGLTCGPPQPLRDGDGPPAAYTGTNGHQRPRAGAERRRSRHHLNEEPLSRDFVRGERGESKPRPPGPQPDGPSDHDALARDAAAVADLLDLGVDEQIGVAALKRPPPERLDLLVEQPRDQAHLTLGDRQPETLDELIDPPRRHSADIRLLHHADERLLAALARLQEAREVAALPGLRDLQLDLTRARVPPPRPIAVAMRRTILGALTTLRADQLGHLRLHQLLRHQPHRLADHVTVLLTQHPANDLLDRHPLGTGHRWRLLSSTPWNEPTILSATVAATTSVPSDRLLGT